MSGENQSQNEGFPSAPPPPEEVKIRTMRSDLASMAHSGGGLPQFQSVRIDEFEGEESTGGGKRVSFGIAIVIVAIVVVLAVIGYFAYMYLKK